MASDDERDPASEWLFNPRAQLPFIESPGELRGRVISADSSDFCPSSVYTRMTHLRFSSTRVPALSIAADPGTIVTIAATAGPDWLLRFRAEALGRSATQQLRQLSIRRVGGTVFVGSSYPANQHISAFLHVQAPREAPLSIHVSFGSVEVRDFAGPLRAAALHGRLTLLNTLGQVDAIGRTIDFAGSRGRVVLSAEADINLKLTAERFDGSLVAWSQGPVRVRVPERLTTAVRAVVGRRDQFVCRARLSSPLNGRSTSGTFTYDNVEPTLSDAPINLRSEHSTIVIDPGDKSD